MVLRDSYPSLCSEVDCAGLVTWFSCNATCYRAPAWAVLCFYGISMDAHQSIVTIKRFVTLRLTSAFIIWYVWVDFYVMHAEDPTSWPFGTLSHKDIKQKCHQSGIAYTVPHACGMHSFVSADVSLYQLTTPHNAGLNCPKCLKSVLASLLTIVVVFYVHL